MAVSCFWPCGYSMHILRLSGDGGCMFCSPKVSDLSALRRHHSAPRARILTSFLCMHNYSIMSCNYAYIISLSASYSKDFLPDAGQNGRFYAAGKYAACKGTELRRKSANAIILYIMTGIQLNVTSWFRIDIF